MLTKQEIFDRVATHLLRQGAQAMEGIGSCRYRTDDGKRCAVGCLITDDAYNPNMEGGTVLGLFESYPEAMKASGLSYEYRRFLKHLQEIHDEPEYGVSGWPSDLRHFAKRENLDPSVLDNPLTTEPGQ